MNTNIFIAKTLWKKDSSKKSLAGGSAIIAGISVAVSIMVMILSITISDGFKKEIKSKTSGLSGEIMLHSPGVEITTSQYPVSSTPSFFDSIANLKSVAAVQPYVYRSAIIKQKDHIQGVVIKGVDSFFDWSFFESVLKEGALPRVDTTLVNPQVLISRRLADMLDYSVGETILIYFIDNSVKVRKFVLSGIYDAQLEDVDESLLISSAHTLQSVNNWSSNEVSGLEVKLKNGYEIPQTAAIIEEIIEEAPLEETYFITTVDELFPHLFDWLRLLDFNVLIIMFLMLAVAGFNMISGLLILLFEKISMIGVLKSLGMRDSSIHKIFLIRALFLVLGGMFIGNIIAFVLVIIQQYYKVIPLDPSSYFVDHVPIYINWFKILLLNCGALCVIVLLLMIPSLFISKISPDKTVRVK
ncbi:MAG: ABC transporter permease [Bacteroidales bacterium]|nr:ABC transporter permease [Bacteroidales bacterium]